MKTIAALFVPFFALCLSASQAQTTSGSATTQETAPATQESPSTTAAPAENPLFNEPSAPADMTSQSEPAEQPQAKPAKKSGTKTVPIDAEEIRKHVLFRKAKTQALKDPRFDELITQADAAKTDPEKRVIMRKYYTLLFNRMAQIDPSIAPLIEQKRRVSINRLSQANLRELGHDPRLP